MTETEVLTAVRQLAHELDQLAPGERVTNSEVYRNLQSQPGKGGPLMQWFNRETIQSRKNVISDILGHFARTAYQQKPEFNKNAAQELRRLCDLLQPLVVEVSEPAPMVTVANQTELAMTKPTEVSDATRSENQSIANYQQAIALWNAGGLTWAAITERVCSSPATWKAFSAAVKRFAAKTEQTLRVGNVAANREVPNSSPKSR